MFSRCQFLVSNPEAGFTTNKMALASADPQMELYFLDFIKMENFKEKVF
jgi:hypothetical protein